jgi:hypothetical protein
MIILYLAFCVNCIFSKDYHADKNGKEKGHETIFCTKRNSRQGCFGRCNNLKFRNQ